MTLEEIRRINLLLIREVLFRSGQVAFAAKLGVNQGEISSYEQKERAISDYLARKIEKEFGLQIGWMDRNNAEMLLGLTDVDISLLHSLKALPANVKPAIATLASELKIGLSNG